MQKSDFNQGKWKALPIYYFSHFPVKLTWRYAHITWYNGNGGVPHLAFMQGAMDGVSTFRHWAPINLLTQDQSHRPIDHITSPAPGGFTVVSTWKSEISGNASSHGHWAWSRRNQNTHSRLPLCCSEISILRYTLPIQAIGVRGR
jgi:hypothetical protein